MLRGVALFLVSMIYFAINFYIANTLNKFLKSTMNYDYKIILALVFTVGALSTLAAYILSAVNVGGFIGKFGVYWLGFSLVSFFIIITTKIISNSIFKDSISIKYVSIFQIIMILGVLSYGLYNQSRTKVIDYSLKINKESELDKLKLVLISDLHLGYFNDNNKLKKDVEEINNQNPDLVVIAGDLFDGNFKAVQSSEETRDILNSINSKYGTYLSWGNHDAGKNFNKMKEFIKGTDIILLDDKVVNIEDKFIIAGRKDPTPIGNQGKDRKDELEELKDEDLPIIVVEHQPSTFEEHEEIADLVLAGHTHKGQIFPFNLITDLYYEIDYGLHQFDSGAQAVVTSGLGTWGPPLRIGSNNEIVNIDIKFK